MCKSICKLKTSGKIENIACYEKYQVFTIMLSWDPKLYYMGKVISLWTRLSSGSPENMRQKKKSENGSKANIFLQQCLRPSIFQIISTFLFLIIMNPTIHNEMNTVKQVPANKLYIILSDVQFVTSTLLLYFCTFQDSRSGIMKVSMKAWGSNKIILKCHERHSALWKWIFPKKLVSSYGLRDLTLGIYLF